MKSLTSRVVVLIVVGLCAIAAQAQTSKTMYANIPFSFNIGEKYMDSGRYTINLFANNVESWRDANGKPVALFVALHKETMGEEDRPRLVFHRYGDQYVLSEVWSDTSAQQVLPSKFEKRLAQAPTKESIALLTEAPIK